ncbi:MAG: tetratricopeptide repeat protein, partial [Candidatus Poseidonia sp.]|nr:tetratricopeptide repeat protein [Poseidonia sp.]
MTEPIRSPDGEWIWSGSTWLAAPPSLDQGGLDRIDITDKVRTTDAAVSSPKSSSVPQVLLKDSAMTGNITIHQSNADDIVSGVMDALDSFGLSNRFSPGRLTRNQCGQVRQVLDLSDSLLEQNIEMDPYVDLRLGDAAELAGWNDAARVHYERALKRFKSSGDQKGEARSYHGLGLLEERRGDYKRAERYERESLSLARMAEDKETQADALTGLGHLLSQ